MQGITRDGTPRWLQSCRADHETVALEPGSDLEFLARRADFLSDLGFLASEKPQVAVAGGKIRDLTPSYGLIAAMTLPMN